MKSGVNFFGVIWRVWRIQSRSQVTLATQRSNGVAHLRYRWLWQQCWRFPLVIRPGNGGEIERGPGGLHSPSYPGVQRSPPAMALPVRPAAIVSANQITRHYHL